ncbi:MAG TPA: AAA family ATPase, partial [Acetobacteraceae bacterium]
MPCGACGSLNPPGANFCSECGAGLTIVRSGTVPQSAVGPAFSAERRQLTVLFCDLVGSTALSARLDPEDLGTLTRAYQRQVAEAMARFGGFVARYLGDGVLVYFGWPRASEADPEQALRAALATAEAVAAKPTHGEALRVRIGIATGLVVVGDKVDAGEAQEQTAIGETPNRAAQLQGLAKPGGIIIDGVTRRLVAGLFEVHAMGRTTLKGLTEPIEVFELRGEHADASRFEALRAAKLTPLIGRQEELDLLLRRWRRARDGLGRVILLAGEPGIGKSRLLAELNERLSGERFRRLRLFCSPHTTHVPLYPMIRHIEFDAGFTRDNSSTERAAKLRARLESVDATAEDIALITALLRLPGDGLPSLNLSPQRRKERTFAALLRRVERMSTARPLLIIFEDMHWADPTTRELIDDLIQRLNDLRVLLVITFRPEFAAPWVGHAGVTSIMLSRLERSESAILAEQFAMRHVLRKPLLDQIVEQSDGVPLFIEELTKAMVEAAPESTALTPQVAVPATLQASLLARLDRMPAARQVAQIGSVFGRGFPRVLLGAVADLPAETLDEGLNQLVAAGLLFRRGEGNEADYVFKHALVQDAAYDSLLRARRAALHGAIGALMEGDPETAASRPVLLGHHFALAGNVKQASFYFLRAGEQSVATSAMTEAEAHVTRGLALAAEIASPADRNRRKAELTLTLGNVRMAVQGIGSPGHRAIFAEAAELCRTLDPQDTTSARLLARVLFGQWTYELQAGNLTRALEIGQDLYAAGGRSRDPELRAAASGHAIGYTFLGRLEDGIAAFAPAIADTGIREHAVPMLDFGFDPTCHLYAQYAR